MPTKKEQSYSDAVRDFYQAIRARVEEADEDSMSMFKFLAIGAGATAAAGVVLLSMYRLLGTSERDLQHKLNQSRLRLLNSSRRKQGRAAAATAADADADDEHVPAASTSAEPMSPGRIFEQFRSAYVEDKDLRKHTGGCHCGRVRFIVEAPADLQCVDSDRNMYTLKGRFPHVVVPKGRVLLLTSSDHLSVYHFGNLPVGPVQEVFEFQNLFCKTCGVHCFGYNKAKDTMHVNSMALDMDTVNQVTVAFESDRSSWIVMNPLLYHPSIGGGAHHHHHDDDDDHDRDHHDARTGGTYRHDDPRTGTYVPTPWKASASAPTGGAYSDLSSLGVAAGGVYGAGLAPLPAKLETPMAATAATTGKQLSFPDDLDDFDARLFFEAAVVTSSRGDGAGNRLVVAVDDDDSDDVLAELLQQQRGRPGSSGGDDATAAAAKQQAFSVERLRRHLSKHVPTTDEAAVAAV